MRRTVSNVAALALPVMALLFAVSCDDDDVLGLDDPDFTATLNAANEVPTNSTAGTGFVTFKDNGTNFEWTMELTDMSAVFASHVHGPAPVGTNAPVMINLFIPNGTSGTLNGVIASGTITNANNAGVTVDSLRTLFNNGNAYVNVHTTPFPGGAIRAQVVPAN